MSGIFSFYKAVILNVVKDLFAGMHSQQKSSRIDALYLPMTCCKIPDLRSFKNFVSLPPASHSPFRISRNFTTQHDRDVRGWIALS